MTTQKLPVFLTVDTEIWPYKYGWPKASSLNLTDKDLAKQFAYCILGMTAQGELGLRYQMALLNRHGLRATFFIEALHAAAVGDRWLAETVGMVTQAGHDIQMHAHTEWLSDASDPALPPHNKQFIREFSIPDQVRILSWVKKRLERCGAKKISAFRAGNFGASLDTLSALAQIGVPIDSSYNKSFLGNACMINAPEILHQRCSLGQTDEFPVTVFMDYPGHFRPIHLAACSSAEIERALLQAWHRGWNSFVMLWHGPELLRTDFNDNGPARPSRIVIRRFERMCSFLAENRDKFQTMMFGDVTPSTPALDEDFAPLNSTPMLTAHRLFEQVIGKVL